MVDSVEAMTTSPYQCSSHRSAKAAATWPNAHRLTIVSTLQSLPFSSADVPLPGILFRHQLPATTDPGPPTPERAPLGSAGLGWGGSAVRSTRKEKEKGIDRYSDETM